MCDTEITFGLLRSEMSHTRTVSRNRCGSIGLIGSIGTFFGSA